MVTQYHEINYVHVIIGVKKRQNKERLTTDNVIKITVHQKIKIFIARFMKSNVKATMEITNYSQEENCPFHILWRKKSYADHE